MNSYVYDADIYCERCAKNIMRRIQRGVDRSADPHAWPEPVVNSTEADTPQHCGSGSKCLDAHRWSDGTEGGKFLENELTADGANYVRARHAERATEITAFWMDFYNLWPNPAEDT